MFISDKTKTTFTLFLIKTFYLYFYDYNSIEIHNMIKRTT